MFATLGRTKVTMFVSFCFSGVIVCQVLHQILIENMCPSLAKNTRLMVDVIWPLFATFVPNMTTYWWHLHRSIRPEVVL